MTSAGIFHIQFLRLARLPIPPPGMFVNNAQPLTSVSLKPFSLRRVPPKRLFFTLGGIPAKWDSCSTGKPFPGQGFALCTTKPYTGVLMVLPAVSVYLFRHRGARIIPRAGNVFYNVFSINSVAALMLRKVWNSRKPRPSLTFTW